MSDLLPILYENAPQMTTCAFCPKPGACCTGFVLTGGSYQGSYKPDEWELRAMDAIVDHNLPFKVIGAYWPKTENYYVAPIYGCDHLTSDGRCGIYESRPQVCRAFVPMSAPLCILYDKDLKEAL